MSTTTKWRVDPEYPTDIQSVDGSMEVARACVFEDGGKIASLPGNAPPLPEAIKNAKLIAAAPDMLAALKEIAEPHGPFREIREQFLMGVIERMQKIALSAIEKATAVQPDSVQ